MVHRDRDRRNVLRGHPRSLGASPGRSGRAAFALLPRHAGSCGHAERVRRGDADRQDARDGRRRRPPRSRRRPRRVPLDRRAPPGRHPVLSEEALILIAVVGACALLVLGVLELIWPSRPRHPVRRAQPAKAPTTIPVKPAPAALAKANFPVVARPAPPAPAKVAPAVEPGSGTRMRGSKASPHARPHAGHAEHVAAREPLPARVPPAPIAPPTPVTTASAPSPPAPPPEPLRSLGPGATLRIDPLLIERCLSLHQDRQYEEVVSVGEEALLGLRDAPRLAREAREAAALWAVVGLAKQALGDDVGAGVALEAALRVAPADERMTYQQHIAALALSAAQTALARAGNHDTDDRIAELRGALAWTERGLAAVPSDARPAGTRERARAELWPVYEQSVHRFLQRREFREARRLLREALEDPEIPTARVAPFEELLSGTFGGEIGQLTAQAIRSMQEARESEALAALRRAEELLETIPDEALPPKRREEVDQRLWWGYTRLGGPRVSGPAPPLGGRARPHGSHLHPRSESSAASSPAAAVIPIAYDGAESSIQCVRLGGARSWSAAFAIMWCAAVVGWTPSQKRYPFGVSQMASRTTKNVRQESETFVKPNA